jgi:hypothetical protein
VPISGNRSRECDEVPEIDQQGAFEGERAVPPPVLAEDLEAAHLVGKQHRHDPVVGGFIHDV